MKLITTEREELLCKQNEQRTNLGANKEVKRLQIFGQMSIFQAYLVKFTAKLRYFNYFVTSQGKVHLTGAWTSSGEKSRR